MKLLQKYNIRKQIIGESMLYFIIWLSIYLVPFMNAGLTAEKIADVVPMLLLWLKILPFYVLFVLNNHLLYPFLFAHKRYGLYMLVSVILVVSVFIGLEIYEQAENIGIAWPFGPTDLGIKRQHISLTVFPWWGNILSGLLMFWVNDIIRILYGSMKADEDKAHLDQQKSRAEMNYLKHQINPHFLMNTLNNIHALIDIDTDGAKQSIIQLSDMMRYVVYDTGEDAIPLKQDIKFIEDYIELMRIRYPEDVDITFAYPQNIKERVMVPPLIFVVFIENAFKHGVSYNHKSFIHIEITYADGVVTAHFENSLAPKEKPLKSGIGLENVRKRLDLIYGKNYKLEIEDKLEDRYSITLQIHTINDKMHSNRR